jgi:uncharacterized protein
MPITLIFAGALALMNVALAMRVGQVRHGSGVSVGHGGHEPLERRMRAHANFIEYAPFTLILVALIEVATGTHAWLAAVAAVFVVARVLHPVGMDGAPKFRTVATAITFAVLIGLGGYAVWVGAAEAQARITPLPFVLSSG